MKQYLYLITILLFSNALKAQSGSWVWLKGDSTISTIGIYGDLGVASPINEPPARYQAAYWTDLNGDFWIYGGVGVNLKGLSDLWKYSSSTNEWTWINGSKYYANPSPTFGTMGVPSILNNPPALGYGANCWIDKNGDLWLFSGFDFSSFLNHDVLWRYNIATNEWTWMNGSNTTLGEKANYGIQGVESNTNTPGYRTECKSAWVYKNKLWFFGGKASGDICKNDLWSYNLLTNNWVWESGTSLDDHVGNFGTIGVSNITNVPPSRFSYTRWQDVDSNFYLFGGGSMHKNREYNDVWKYNHSLKMWTWISGTNTINNAGTKNPYCDPDKDDIPMARYENQTTETFSFCTRAFWTFGGFSLRIGTKPYNDLWLFNTANLEWTKIKGFADTTYPFKYGVKGVANENNLLPGRGGHSAWTDKEGGLYVFGGLGFGGYYGDLWKFIPDATCFKTGLVGNIKINPPSDTLLCAGDTIKMSYPMNCIIDVSPLKGVLINTNKNQVEFFGSETTKYTLISRPLDPSNTCFKADTVSFIIKTNSRPKADFNIIPNNEIDYDIFNFLNQSSNATKYEWYYERRLISTEKDIVKKFSSLGKHCISLVAINECDERDSLTKCLEVYPNGYQMGKILVPNGFTPNGDNKNDLFKAIVSSPVQKYSLLIVNRYGQEIFKTDNPNQGWDGRFNSQDQNVGVYYYLIKVKFDTPDAKEEMFKGDITLIR